MTETIPGSSSRLAAADSRPLVVTLVVVGYLLIFGLSGLNAAVVLANGSPSVVLGESESANPFAQIERGDEYSEFLPEPPNPRLAELDRIFSAGFVVIAICGFAAAIGLFRKHTWSRVGLWGATAAGILGHAAYVLLVLQTQSAEILDVREREQAFELVASMSLINVAIQSIPVAILAGLLRHSALRSYVFDSPRIGKIG